MISTVALIACLWTYLSAFRWNFQM